MVHAIVCIHLEPGGKSGPEATPLQGTLGQPFFHLLWPLLHLLWFFFHLLWPPLYLSLPLSSPPPCLGEPVQLLFPPAWLGEPMLPGQELLPQLVEEAEVVEEA